MKNPQMPEDRQYVVVSKARMPHNKRFITHVYGPYGQAKAKSVKSNMKRQAEERGYELEVSVCHVLDPDTMHMELQENRRA